MARSPSQGPSQHIESFVDASRSSTLQASSLDEIITLLKNGTLTIESLVKELEMYLTTTDFILRARGILLLGEVLAHISSKPLDDATVHTLISFFTERLADWRALRGALVGCLALLRRKTRGVVSDIDAKAVANSYLENLHVQSLGQHDRKLCFELLQCLLEKYAGPLAPLGEVLVSGICAAIDDEKDPQCLMLTFHIVEILVQVFPDPRGPVSSYASDLIATLGSYFPIHFTHAIPEEAVGKRDELSRALMLAFSATPLFEPFVIPLLLDKLSSSLQSAKVDSLKFLNYCSLKYGAERMAKHAGIIWFSLKEALRASGNDLASSFFSPESLDGSCSVENEMGQEALMLLESVIIQNTDLFLNLIVEDEDMRMILVKIKSPRSYNEFPMQAKKEIQVVCQILYVSAKASFAACNRAFGSFLPSLMETLGYSIDNGVILRRAPCGPLLLCTELLRACRDLCTGSGDLKPVGISNDMICCILLQRFHASLCMIFQSNLSTTCQEPAEDVDIYLGVKGLQILATFPGGYSLIPKLTFDNILTALVATISVDYEKFSWKLALKALVNIGSFIHACTDSEKAMSYNSIVLEAVLSFISSSEFSMPFSLKLEVLSNIGASGLSYMLKIVQVLEEVIITNLEELFIHGNTKSSKALLQLLECYSDKLVPWFHQNGGHEEVLLQLVVNIWNKVENCENFPVQLHEKDVLDATMKLMKLAMASFSVQRQNAVVCKAYTVLFARMSPSLKESLSSFPVGLRAIDLTEEMHLSISRNEWVQSLFASVIIALRPQTQLPNIRLVLRFFMCAFMQGHTIAAQALGSLVNKLDPNSGQSQVLVNCTLEEAMEILFDLTYWNMYLSHPIEGLDFTSNGNSMNLASIFCSGKNEELQTHAIVGLAWIGKGLLVRGHERVRDITMVFLECILSNGRNCLPVEALTSDNSVKHGMHLSVVKSAADAFQILMSDSEICLNRKFHSVLRPLYKQRFFSTVIPILQSLIIKSDSPVMRYILCRAFAHVISETPLTAVSNDAKKLIPLLVDSLKLLSKDVLDKDIIYSLLLVLSGILTDRNGQEAAVENARIIVDGVIGLVNYPHMMVVRETAVQCLGAMSNLPYTTIYPMRIQVIQATLKALDDPKRAVRLEAVKCHHAWASIASGVST